jgi:1-acyl-sn-glycerol-3-phosphate acyltransferase
VGETAGEKAGDFTEAGGPPSDRDASERLVQAEGVDAPQHRPAHPPSQLRRRRAETLEVAGVERPSDPDIGARIRELEARLDRMIVEHAQQASSADLGDVEDELEDGEADHEPDDGDVEDGKYDGGADDGLDEDEPATVRSHPPPPPSRSALAGGAPPAPEGVFDTARELLSTDFYLRKWGRLGMRSRAEEIDEFGYDPVYEQKVLPFFDFLYEKYFRVEIQGAERIPSEGRCLLVANHSGTLPLDGMMLRQAIRREHPRRRELRWLAEDAIFHFPFLGSMYSRLGAVRACQENAERLLDHGALVAVFPEGMKGIGKLFKQRYKLQRFGRGGFVKLCLRTRTPVVPIAVIGGEETNPMLTRIEYLTKAIGVPYVPVTPTFPLLGPLGLVPAPTKWRIVVGQPLEVDGYGAESSEDEILVGRLTEQVRSAIQGMLDRALAERRSVWFG